MANTNRLRNGGFEQSAAGPDPGPFWTVTSGSVTVETAGTQLLGSKNVLLLPNSSISQPLLPLQVGEIYEFSIAFSSAASSGTVSIAIGGIATRSFQAGNLVNITDYSQYHFAFQAATSTPTLTITNNSNSLIRIDIVSVYLQPSGNTFEWQWGEETIIWADSSAPGPGNGTPSDPFTSLQAAVTAATTSSFANTFGMRARLIILIAANSAFDEDIIIPPARHVQLLGLGPWVLGDASLANFGSSTPRNITIQTSQAAENVYLSQGPAFDARPVTVIGTFDNGTSVSTHTNYTNGAIISGDVIFQNVDLVDPTTTIEFQLLNARVVGSIIQDPVDPHLSSVNAYIYNSRINIMVHTGLRIQRMVDSLMDGMMHVLSYSHITNTFIDGDVTVGSASGDVPPTGIFSSQFSTITWDGPLVLDTSSNYYFVDSSSTLNGTKTVLFSTD